MTEYPVTDWLDFLYKRALGNTKGRGSDAMPQIVRVGSALFLTYHEEVLRRDNLWLKYADVRPSNPAPMALMFRSWRIEPDGSAGWGVRFYHEVTV